MFHPIHINTTSSNQHNSTHYVFVLDNSWSMSWSVSQMRTDLKNKLSTLVKPKDLVTILTFSSAWDVRTVVAGWDISDVSNDTNILHKAIDEHVSARSLTCFDEALDLACKLISWYSQYNTSVLFLTDGYHNNWWSRKTVIDIVTALSKLANNFTVAEYGTYCDHSFLCDMVEAAAQHTVSNLIFQENVRYFEPVLDSFTSWKVFSNLRVEIDVPNSNIPFVFAWEQRFNVVNWKAIVPADIWCVYGFNLYEPLQTEEDTDRLYALCFHLAQTRSIDLLYQAIEKLGDMFLWEIVCNSFGVEFTRATEYIRQCITDKSLRRKKWSQPQWAVPAPDAFCVLDLLSLLQDGDCMLFPWHKDFSYNVISRKKVQRSTLWEDGQQPYELKFVNSDPDKGYSLKDLVWKKDRANISISITYRGSVDVSHVPWNTYWISEVPTYTVRNYAIIADGRKNITTLPVSVDFATYKILFEEWVISDVNFEEWKIFTIDISNIPVINRQMVAEVSAAKLAALSVDELKLQAGSKVIKYLLKQRWIEKENPYEKIYSEEVTSWLKSIWFDHNGFNPKMVGQESTDYYVAQVVNCKIAKFSSLPKVEECISKWWTPSKDMIHALYNMASALTDEELKQGAEIIEDSRKKIQKQIATMTFSLIVGQNWFSDYAEWDAVSIVKDGETFNVSIEVEEENIII